MKTWIKNLLLPLARFKAATWLNVIGLTTAFASFCIIMMQVRYDLTYDKGYSTADKIYTVDIWNAFQQQEYTAQASQFLIDEIREVSPDIREVAYIDERDEKAGFFDPQRGPEGTMTESLVMASGTLPSVFGLECVEGDPEGFKTPGAAMLSQSTARRLFGNESPVGKQLCCVRATKDSVDNLQIVGIYKDLPTNSSLPNGVIFNIENERITAKSAFLYGTYLLIDTPEKAARIEQALIGRYPQWFPKGDHTQLRPIRVVNLHQRYFTSYNLSRSQGNLTTVYSLIAVAVLILLIVAINFINFSTSLVPLRIRSLNTRKVLGSSTAALRTSLIAEAVVVALFSGLLALLTVYLIGGTSFASLISADMSFGKNLPLMGMTLGVALLTGLVAGAYPAFYSTSFPAALVLKGSFGLSPQGRRLRTGLIGFQYVTSIALYVRTQYEYMRTYDIGMNREQIVATKLTQPMARQQKALTQRLKQHPAVEDVAYAQSDVVSPDDRLWGTSYQGKHVVLTMLTVTPNFLSMMDIPVAEGRNFSPDDQQRQGVYILNQTACRQYDMEVGKVLRNHQRRGDAPIIGVAKDFNFKPLYYPIGPAAFYVEHPDSLENMLYTYVKISGHNPAATLQDIRKTLLEFDPNAANILRVDFMDESCGSFYLKESLLTSQITLFSLLAVLISTAGAFGLIMFETQYRLKEIGLRKVFGATVGDVLRMFNKRYITIVGICFLIAAPAAYYIASHWQNNFTYKAPVTTWIFLAALLTVGLITVTTVTLQSYKSATANPADSVNAE